MINLTFAEKFKELRKEHNYTQKDLANILEVKPTTISAWELGNNSPRMDMLKKISNLFGVNVGYFFDEENNSNNKREFTLEEALASVMSYDGKPMTDNDKEIIEGIIKGYMENKKK